MRASRSQASVLDLWLRADGGDPDYTIISDSLVQAGLLVFREALLSRLRRDAPVCLVSVENDPLRLLEAQVEPSMRLRIIDCFNDQPQAQADSSPSKMVVGRYHYAHLDDFASILHSARLCEPGTTFFVDGLDTLRAYSGSTATLRLLRNLTSLSGSVRNPIVMLLHSDYAPLPSTSHATDFILQDLVSAAALARSASVLDITLTSPAILAHLETSYGIEIFTEGSNSVSEDVGSSNDSQASTVTPSVLEYLPRLHARAWGSPLSWTPEDVAEAVAEGAHGSEAQLQNSTSLPAKRHADSPDARDVELNCLAGGHKPVEFFKDGRHALAHMARGIESARSVALVRSRGVARSGKLADASKKAHVGVYGFRGYSGPMDGGAQGLTSKRLLIAATAAKAVLALPSMTTALNESQRRSSHLDSASAADPHQTAFNLALTDRQRDARDATALPYTPKGGEILYMPDSADDLDESDPDEDLDL